MFVYDAVMLALLQIFKLPFGSQNNVVFTAPTDGYARVSAQGVLEILNSNDGLYAPMCVNRYTTGNQITQSLYVRKGTPLKWQADDGSTSIVFWPIVS